MLIWHLKIQAIDMRQYNIIGIIFILLCSLSVSGQQSFKKHLTTNDYDRWGTLEIKNISPLGKWTSYEMTYDSGKDTLFLQQTSGKKCFSFPKGKQGIFGGEKWFGFIKEANLTLVDLKNFSSKQIKNVKRFELVNGGAYVVTHHLDNSLKIRDLKVFLLDSIGSVNNYSMNHKRDALIYNQELDGSFVAGCVRFKDYDHSIVTQSKSNFDSFTWNYNGTLVVFSNGSGLEYYNLTDKRLFTFDITSLSDYLGAHILKSGLTGFRISNDGDRVFFSVAKSLPIIPKTKVAPVEVWNGNDSIFYTVRQELATRDTPKLVVWQPLTGQTRILSDDVLYKVRLTGNGNYVLLSNPFSYGLEPAYYEKVDYYLKDVKTGAQQLFLKKQSHDSNLVCVGPFNDLIVAYVDKNWWLYNPADGSKRNLTQAISAVWDNDNVDAPRQFGTFGLAGWTADGKSVLLYDAYDIWQVSLDGTSFSRLTFGREQQIVYRINRMELEKIKSRSYDSGLVSLINLEEKFLLDCVGENGSSGYALYNKSKGVTMLTFENKYLSGIKRSANNSFVFSTETFSQSPQVTFVKEGCSSKTLFKSNKQQSSYYYGHSELISYKDGKGRQLKGVLFYPANYRQGKHYPMLVHVYEKLASKLHWYVNPSLYNGQGFSVTHSTLNGYFVLMPDIFYELGSTGQSAADCIVSATKSVIQNYPVDARRIGLIGHSFGGFETLFTITQSNLFAAAVSGAGVSDPIKHYFELDKNGSPGKDSMWKFESQQMRFGDSFFNMKEAYLSNSALINADKITTPLLQWFGKEDKVIPGDQSIALYLALRRLRKPTVLLQYPDEAHNLWARENQIDLTVRISQWFDYYLKDKKDVAWINNGTLAK